MMFLLAIVFQISVPFASNSFMPESAAFGSNPCPSLVSGLIGAIGFAFRSLQGALSV